MASLCLGLFHEWVRYSNSEAEMKCFEKAEGLLGYSFKYYKAFLDSKFSAYPGLLSWKTKQQWDIDHIQPISQFDLHTAEGCGGAFGSDNTQPLPDVLNAAKLPWRCPWVNSSHCPTVLCKILIPTGKTGDTEHQPERTELLLGMSCIDSYTRVSWPTAIRVCSS